MNGHDDVAEEVPWQFGNEPVDEPLNLRRETARFRDDPLQPLLALLGQERVRLIQDEPARYATAYEYYYLSLRRYLRAMSVSIRWQRGPRWLRGLRLGPRQRLVAAEFNQLVPFFELDFVNCLVHARMVCDRAIALSRHFLRDQPIPSFNSFHDQKRFFTRLTQQYEPHEMYAAYFRDNTAWFDMPLKPVRDQYFVHQGPRHMRFLGYDTDHDLQMIIVIPNGPDEAPFGGVQTISVSVRRLARDLDAFLTWFNTYGVRALGDFERSE
jgi:hypothetical protein